MKVIIIGRGPSVLKCTKDFVDKHDMVVVVNKFVFKGYEEFVGERADIQFRNKGCTNFSRHEILTLKLKEIIYTHESGGYPSYPEHYNGVKITIPSPTLRRQMAKEIDFDPSSGIIALWYMINNYDISELSIVGFDFYVVGTKPYYFALKDTDKKMRHLWSKVYRGDKINVPSGHNTEKSIAYVKKVIRENNHIKFNIISNAF